MCRWQHRVKVNHLDSLIRQSFGLLKETESKRFLQKQNRLADGKTFNRESHYSLSLNLIIINNDLLIMQTIKTPDTLPRHYRKKAAIAISFSKQHTRMVIKLTSQGHHYKVNNTVIAI